MDEKKQLPERVATVETALVKIDTTFRVIMTLGIVCWALVGGVIVWFLSEITKNIEVTQDLVADVKLVEYRLTSQDKFNADIMQDVAQRKQQVDSRFRELEIQMHNNSYRSNSQN